METTTMPAGELTPSVFVTHFEDFESRVLQRSHQHPVLVDLWAEWCPPCVVLAPLLERIVNEYQGRVALAKLEVDEGENMKIAGRYSARGFPTVIVFVDGEERERFSGARPPDFIRSFIERNLGG